MTTLFSILILLISLLVSTSIWAVFLKIRRFERAFRTILLFGPAVLIGMQFYSLSVIKAADYPALTMIFLSLLYSVAFIILGLLLVGIIIIIAVGGYWLVTTLRQTGYKPFWRRFRRDFSYGWNRIKSWLEGES